MSAMCTCAQPLDTTLELQDCYIHGVAHMAAVTMEGGNLRMEGKRSFISDDNELNRHTLMSPAGHDRFQKRGPLLHRSPDQATLSISCLCRDHAHKLPGWTECA